MMSNIVIVGKQSENAALLKQLKLGDQQLKIVIASQLAIYKWHSNYKPKIFNTQIHTKEKGL